MADTVSQLLANMESYQYNPSLIQRDILAHLTSVTNGEVDIVDPTNPFVFSLEASAVLASAAISKDEAVNRKLYPIAAQTEEDLYLHMSDKDYLERFAVPSKVRIGVVMDMVEVLSLMVDDPETGNKKLVIPRNTYLTVSDTIFSLQYPIVIRQLSHGGLQVVYDAEVTSPLQKLETNIIDWVPRNTGEITWLYFEFDMYQFKVNSVSYPVTTATGFKQTIALEDEFYHTRVYVQNSDESWTEIKTTHTDQIYDINTPTAVLKVIDKTVVVTIPQIYLTTGKVKSKVRIDVYETKGALNMDLGSYATSSFVVTFNTIDTVLDNTIYSAPLSKLKNIQFFSESKTVGGAKSLTFDELRTRVINNAVGDNVIPITSAQAESELSRNGYTIVKNIDSLTNRVFLATKEMPTPSNDKLITAAAASIATASFTIRNAITNKDVINNGDSITLTPKVIYQSINGVIKIVSSEDVEQLLATPADTRAILVTNGNYLYTPFHYVLDMSNDEFDSRPYYLDSPIAVTKTFVAENDTTLIELATGSYSFTRESSGYKLTLVTNSSEDVRNMPDSEVHVQVAYVPKGEKARAYLTGVLLGRNDEGERVYEFDFSTNFNIDSDDYIQLTKFKMFNTEDRITSTPLTNTFDILYSVSSVMDTQWVSNSIDNAIGKFFLPERIAGVMHEQVQLKFGDSLKTLWARARSVVSSVEYARYEADVQRFYTETIYERDPVTGSAVTIVDGVPKFTILHQKGDPVLDALGNPVYQYRKGDVILDSNGDPIPADPAGMLRQIDLLLIEGVYWFGSDSSSISYRTEIVDSMLSWLMEDLTSMTDKLLEQTRIYFYPKATIGKIDVIVSGGSSTRIDASQSFTIDLYVTSSVYNKSDLRKKLKESTISTISSILKKQTVTTSEIISKLKEQYSTDVIDFKISLLADGKYSAVTILDDAARLSIQKRLVSQADDSLFIEEDITFNFSVFN